MDFCPGLLFVVMMIVIWLDDAGFWKWLRKKLK
jgi:Na+/H+ antiporter NhaD/arsenite permease-like protein